MAWIKMRTDLRDDPAVIAIAAKLDTSEDHVVGLLHRLWSWANQQTTDGNATNVTQLWVDRYIGVAGFANALECTGWLDCSNGSVAIPKFDRHNSESAKRRALTADRVRQHRVTRTPLPEKRRVDKSKPHYSAPFLKLWEAVLQHAPHKAKSKGLAQKAYDNAEYRLADVQDDPHAYLLERATAYYSSPEGQTKYANMPSAWLNQARYEDDDAAWERRETDDSSNAHLANVPVIDQPKGPPR